MKNVSEMVEQYLCTGCCRCVAFCPNGYITVKKGELGFPVPDVQKCDDCGACIKSCPFLNEFSEENEDKV